MDFTPTEYSPELEPEAPTGKWGATCKAKKIKTKDKGLPMIILEWKLEESEEEDHQIHLGKSVTDFVSFPGPGTKNGNMSRLQLRKLCEAFDIPQETIPRGQLSSWDDVDDLFQAIDGLQGTIWTITKTQESGESKTRVHYQEPANFGSASDEEEEPEEEKPAPKAKAAAAKGKATAKGKR